MVLGWVALALGLSALGGPVTPLFAAELQGKTAVRIEQLAGVTLVGKLTDGDAEASLDSASLGSSAVSASAELIVTAPPHTAVSLTIAARPPGKAEPPHEFSYFDGIQTATGAAGRVVVPLGAAFGEATRIIVNY